MHYGTDACWIPPCCLHGATPAATKVDEAANGMALPSSSAGTRPPLMIRAEEKAQKLAAAKRRNPFLFPT